MTRPRTHARDVRCPVCGMNDGHHDEGAHLRHWSRTRRSHRERSTTARQVTAQP